MGQKEILVPYKEIAAYNASRGIGTYNVDSGSFNGMLNITISWTETGFTNADWNAGSGPFEDMSENDVNNMDNNDISEAISTWSGSATIGEKLDWLRSLGGCAS